MKYITILFLCLFTLSSAAVLEFDEKFPAVSKQGQWLVMFYAPWCGHCKHMEPVWKELGQRMAGSDVHVGRLDCTKFSSIASIYGVRGFPTIKYFRDGQSFDYNGARNAPSLVNFIKKASGPVVEKLQSERLLKEQISENEVVFSFIGTEVDELWKVYENVAKSMFTDLYFTSIHPNLVKSMNLKFTPAIVVFKDDTFYVMDKKFNKVEMIKLWFLMERLPSYPVLNGQTFGKLKTTGRNLAIAVFVNKGDDMNATVGKVAFKRSQPFTFCWSMGTDIVDSLTYGTIPSPNLVVFDTKSHTYYLLSNGDDGDKIHDESAIEQFLNDVTDGKVPALGGMSIWQQVKRVLFDLAMSLVGFFQDGPILASIVIVIPTVVITFLCVCICTMSDDADAEYDEDEDTDDEQLPAYDQEQPDVELSEGGVRKRVTAATATDEAAAE